MQILIDSEQSVFSIVLKFDNLLEVNLDHPKKLRLLWETVHMGLGSIGMTLMSVGSAKRIHVSGCELQFLVLL